MKKRLFKNFSILMALLITLLFSCDGTMEDMVNGISESEGGGNKTYAIGDIGPSGVGIVFYITDGGLHGLEAAPGDQNNGSGAVWSTITDDFANGSTALPPDTGTGSTNTDAIIAQAIAAGNNNMLTYAAGIARSYRASEEGDWFLPSRDELGELCTQKAVVGGFSDGYYWSSSEHNNDLAWYQIFSNGFMYNYFKDDTYRVRAVRAF